METKTPVKMKIGEICTQSGVPIRTIRFSGILIGAFTLVTTVGIYVTQVPPSSPFAAGLAEHLQVNNGTMYGTSWCPYCQKQKELFGPVFNQKVP